MILAICVDKKMGMQFNHRRQSQDAALRRNLLESSGGRLYLSLYTAGQFDENDPVIASDDYLNIAGRGDWVFAEDDDYLQFRDKIEKIILYHWNRDYPRDLCFRFPGQWRLTESMDFPGTSHDTITREVYIP